MSGHLDNGLIRFATGTVRPRSMRDRSGGRTSPPQARPLKYGKWRAIALTSVYVLFGVHIAHWKLNGTTLAPLELNEVMYTLELGIVTAGFLLMATLFVATAFLGRFFCSWACHILALEDLCAWLLARLRIRPRQVRSRLLLLVPPAVLVYMFVWPQIIRVANGRPAPRWRILADRDGWASFVTTDFWRNLPDPWVAGLTFVVCGFAVVYFLGARSFCFHACPYGAAFAAVDRLALGRIKLTGDCEQCGICTGVCSSSVRVHEEIAQFGRVVDVNCMKDLDCVSACPQKALSYGFTRPSPADSFSETGRRRLKYDFSLAEELAMAAVFLAVLVVFRGLYTAIPLLMTLGMAGIAASLSMLWVRLATRPDVRLIPFRLKRSGRLTAGGYAFSAGMVAFGLFFAHSAFIRYHEVRGQRAFDTVKLAVQRPDAPLPQEALRAAVHHLTTARRWGLVRPLVRDDQLASLQLKSSDPTLAEPYLRRIVRRDPRDADSHLALAQLLARSGRSDEAEAATRAALDAPPASSAESAGGYALLGWILAERGNIEESVAAYRAAATLDDTRVPTHMALGELLAENGRFAEAAVSFRRVTALQPDLAVAHYNLGVALTSSGDPTGAITVYEQLLVLLPDDLQALTNLGFLHAGLGEHRAAAMHFQRVIDLHPGLARPHFNLARVHEALGNAALAERHYRLAAELDPEYAHAYSTPN